MTDKVFKTYREQCRILQQRGLVIEHERFFTHKMQQDDYYNIINGYKKYFLTSTSPDHYIPDTTFEQVYALYEFDQAIRSLFLTELLRIEKHVKSLIAYHFSAQHGYDHRQYLSLDCFKHASQNNIHFADIVITKLRGDIIRSRRTGNAAICHYLSAYGYVPLWVLNSVISFGRIAHFYSCMYLAEQQAVAYHFKMPASTMDGFIYFLNDFRNACAHGNRMYTSDSQPLFRKFIPDTPIHAQLDIPRNQQGNYIAGKSDMLAKLIAMRYFMGTADFRRLKNRFRKAHRRMAAIVPLEVLKQIDTGMGLSPTILSML